MKILGLTDIAFEQFRTGVKGNEKISKDQAARKLTRNVDLAKRVFPRNLLELLTVNKFYRYGNLDIVVRWGTIVYVHNNPGVHRKWKEDVGKHRELSIELGIKDSKFCKSEV